MCKDGAVLLSIPGDRYIDAAGARETKAWESDLCPRHTKECMIEALTLLYKRCREHEDMAEVRSLLNKYKFKELM